MCGSGPLRVARRLSHRVGRLSLAQGLSEWLGSGLLLFDRVQSNTSHHCGTPTDWLRTAHTLARLSLLQSHRQYVCLLS